MMVDPKAEIIYHYFPELSDRQKEQFKYLEGFFDFWNPKVNLVSRKDIHALYVNHVLHSLAIARYTTFHSGTNVLDVGTGGGFPGIPLAILFPEVSFHLVDSIGKKIKLVQSLADELKLQNISTEQARVEQLKGKYNYIVSRAVTTLPVMYNWVRDLLNHSKGDPQSGGILYLKGGEFADELRGLPVRHRLVELQQYFEEPFFNTKKLVHLY